MKTSTKVMLESLKIDKELRINVELIDIQSLRDQLSKINHLIDELNSATDNEKIFLLEETIKLLLKFANETFILLYKENSDKIRNKFRSDRLKSFLDVTKNNQENL